MFRLIVFVIGLGVINTWESFSQKKDPCNLFGSVHITKKRQLADYFVYIEEESQYSADLVVFLETNALYADRTGIWYSVDNRAFANFTIFLVDKPGRADFSVFYTDEQSYADCN